MSYFNNAEWYYMGTLDTSGANTLDFIPGGPIDVKRILLVVTTAMTTADAILTIGKRTADLAGSSSTYATVTIPYASGADGARFIIDFPVGTAVETSDVYIDQSGDTAPTVYSGGPGLLQIDFGEELFITSNGGGDAGVSAVYAEYVKQGLNDIYTTATPTKLSATLA